MKINVKFVLALAVALISSAQVAAQNSIEEMEEIASRLAEKYEDVESCMTYDGLLFCVKKNDVWEFADTQGKLLTKMNISAVENNWASLVITINDKRYDVDRPLQDGRLLVSQYGRYAYMHKNGKLLTSFVYNSSGEEVFDSAESAEAIRVNDSVGNFIEEYRFALNPPAESLLDIVDASNVHLLIDDYAEQMTGGLVRYSLNNPDKIDKEKLGALFQTMYQNEDASFTTKKAIAAYFFQTAASDEERFRLIQDMANSSYDAESNTLCGDMLRNGQGCEQDVQAAIRYYENAVINGSRDASAENARQALRELWQSDSTRYENRYGRLLSCYDDFRVIQDYVAVKRNGLTGICDTTFTELLPCSYKSVKCLMDPLFAIVNFDDGVQLVRRGGEELTTNSYDDMLIVQYNLDNSFIVFAEKDNKWCILDAEGKSITPLVFDDVYMPYFSFGENYPTITKDEEMFDLFRIYKSQRAIIRQNDLYGLMDTNGNIVVPCQYATIEPFEDGATTTKAQNEDDTWVTIDLNH